MIGRRNFQYKEPASPQCKEANFQGKTPNLLQQAIQAASRVRHPSFLDTPPEKASEVRHPVFPTKLPRPSFADKLPSLPRHVIMPATVLSEIQLFKSSKGFSIVRTRTFYGHSSPVCELPRCGYSHARNQGRVIHMNSDEEPQLSGDKNRIRPSVWKKD